MPNANKKVRGRRAAKAEAEHNELALDLELSQGVKRKREPEEHEEPPVARLSFTKPLLDASDSVLEIPNIQLDLSDRETPFYGLLNDEEQAYFSRANDVLELDNFNDKEEKQLFLANVYREAAGKELKLACSQSCSRFMERLMHLSSIEQLQALFKQYRGHFIHLVQHRFASHCCETLFVRCAPAVTDELIKPTTTENVEDDEIENLFLYVLDELEGNLGYLLTDRFASHVLRALLIILSGLPLSRISGPSSPSENLKNQSTIVHARSSDQPRTEQQRLVPDSFKFATGKILSDIKIGLDTNSLRALAIHPSGNPVLQLVIEIQSLKSIKPTNVEESLVRTLLPDELPTEGTLSGQFINGLLYDAVGSRLLETIVAFAPGKTFRNIYKSLFKDRIGSLARHETASYVTSKILERLGKDDLQYAMVAISSHIGDLLERSRTATIKTLIARCMARGVDMEPLAQALESEISMRGSSLLEILHVNDIIATKGADVDQKLAKNDARRVHGSLLAQTLLSIPGQLSGIVYNSIGALSQEALLRFAHDPASSRVLQSSMVLPTSAAAFRRKTINQFLGHVMALAVEPSGSHVVDSFWIATRGLGNYGERIAEELLKNEVAIKDSRFGRAVWRNWSMDIYKRRKSEWIAKSRESKTDQPAVPGASNKMNGKSKIELARARFASQITNR